MTPGYGEFGCWWCQVRYWAGRLAGAPFHYCERCRVKMRLTRNAWKAWSEKAAGSPSPH